MKLKFSFLKKILKQKKISEEYYFGLLLKEEEGMGMVLKKDNFNQLVILAEKKFKFSNGWENLVEDVDSVLFQLENQINIPLKKTFVFLYSHLFDKEKDIISPIYYEKIKNLFKELELVGMGYLNCAEAINFFFSKKNELSFSGIIIEIDENCLSFFVYKNNQRQFGKTIGRTSDVLKDIEVIVNEAKEKVILPSLIILYGKGNLLELSQKIILYRWPQNSFIQLPRVEIFDEKKINQCLIFSLSSQLSDFFFSNEKKEKEEKEEKEKKEKKQVMGFYIDEDIPQKKISLPSFNFSFFPLFLIGGGLIFLGVFFLILFFHRANLTVFFPKEKLEEKTEISFTDFPLEKFEETLEKEKTIETSGEKIVGEKARGEVTIYNNSFESLELKKETLFQTEEGIKFLLDNDVKIASASQTLTSEGNFLTVAGKANANLTAAEIGSSSNIEKGKRLKVGDYSMEKIFAITSESFTGGSQRKIRTVSKDDREKLKEELSSLINKEAISFVKRKTRGKEIISSSIETKILDETYSKEIGEEADKLSLKIKAKVTGFFFSPEKLKEYLAERLKDKKGEYQILADNISYQIEEFSPEKETIQLKTTAFLLPKISLEKMKKRVKGKDLKKLNEIIKQEFKADGYEVEIDAKLPFLKNFMPFFEKNISLKVKSL